MTYNEEALEQSQVQVAELNKQVLALKDELAAVKRELAKLGGRSPSRNIRPPSPQMRRMMSDKLLRWGAADIAAELAPSVANTPRDTERHPHSNGNAADDVEYEGEEYGEAGHGVETEAPAEGEPIDASDSLRSSVDCEPDAAAAEYPWAHRHGDHEAEEQEVEVALQE